MRRIRAEGYGPGPFIPWPDRITWIRPDGSRRDWIARGRMWSGASWHGDREPVRPDHSWLEVRRMLASRWAKKRIWPDDY